MEAREGKYVHAKFWHKLDNTSELSEVVADKAESDEL
jgi:hypothetical protein